MSMLWGSHEFAHIPEVKRENYYGEEDGYHTGRLSLVTYTDDPWFLAGLNPQGVIHPCASILRWNIGSCFMEEKNEI